jgi:oligopeptide/dipeptide ABC transporter ATP-binding protein
LSLSERQMRRLRGDRLSIVFQDPNAALNPVYSIGWQVAEAVRLHRRVGRREARRRAVELLRQVAFPEPDRRQADYPHQLSGGMRQRAMIAMALACDPELMIADEPTTLLDSLAAAQISGLLADLKRQRQMSMLLISHDLAMVGESADTVVVLYAGQVVEQGPAQLVLTAPRHPYTRALLASVPPIRKRRRRRHGNARRLPTVQGAPDHGHARSDAGCCRFVARCSEAYGACHESEPRMYEAEGVKVRCFLYDSAAVPLVRALPALAPAETEHPAAPSRSMMAASEFPIDSKPPRPLRVPPPPKIPTHAGGGEAAIDDDEEEAPVGQRRPETLAPPSDADDTEQEP